MSERFPFHLFEFFRKHSKTGRPLALVTVLGTEGSTYSKSGHHMLVSEGGEIDGMLSGGCLENDLVEKAQAVMAANESALLTYDLRGDDEIFGLGVGCEGQLQIAIEPLVMANNFEPITTLLSSLEHAPTAEYSLAVAELPPVSIRVQAPLRVLLMGAGLDADPVILFGQTLGWRIDVSDHRPAAIARLESVMDVSARCIPVNESSNLLVGGTFDAVIVMSHNLDADRAYLHALADTKIEYVGLLGPPHRKTRLLNELGDSADSLRDRLRGPVGKRIGGRGPAAIALEIAAELQSHFCGDS